MARHVGCDIGMGRHGGRDTSVFGRRLETHVVAVLQNKDEGRSSIEALLPHSMGKLFVACWKVRCVYSCVVAVKFIKIAYSTCTTPTVLDWT